MPHTLWFLIRRKVNGALVDNARTLLTIAGAAMGVEDGAYRVKCSTL